MVDNLKTTRYRNGELISSSTPADKDITAESEPKYQWAYNGDENNVAKYGRLYTWYAATDFRNIAPEGWHVPTDDEWTEFENYLIANGYNYDETTTENKIAKAMAATTDWVTYEGTGTIGDDLSKNNKSGFTTIPSGYRYDNGGFGNIGNCCIWWTCLEFTKYYAWGRNLYHWDTNMSRNYLTKNYGFSVRCIKDNSNP
jgi:uncharacterized protein (TIGR02145 family)